jgi:hypothetical protein
MWGEKKERVYALRLVGIDRGLRIRVTQSSIAFNLMRTFEQAEVYFGRCDQAAEYLMKGKKVSIHLEVLGQFDTNVKQWLVDLHNAIAVECYDPSDCLEDSCSPEYKLSVLVKNGKAIASAKQVN